MDGIRGQRGFSLVELLVVMTIFIILIAMSSYAFNNVLRQSKQESKKAETQMESIVGLELMRVDIEHAGYGLPWIIPSGMNHPEAAQQGCGKAVSPYNDNTTPPRAIVSGNGDCMNDSDYLVIKSMVVATNRTSQKWSYITTTGVLKNWGSTEDFSASERVIVVRPKFGDTGIRTLVTPNSSIFSATYSAVSAFPVLSGDIIYGVDPDTSLLMPYNRADYYVKRPNDPKDIATRCAPNTGILYKATVNHSDGRLTEHPILDCVADMQVVYRRDLDGDGVIDWENITLAGLSAEEIRQLKEVRVYILAHEGQMDRSFTYPNDKITYADEIEGGVFKTEFDLPAKVGTDWEHYRWKAYTMVVKPKNLF